VSLLKAVLVDDEQLARDELGYLLDQVGGVEVIGQAGNGVEALTTIERLQPELVFLDVQMPGLTGFEVAVDRARRRLVSVRPVESGSNVNHADLEKIIQAVAERQSRRERLAIKVGERFLLVQSEDIIYASLADEGITVVTSQHAGTSNYRTLDELHERLDPTVFWRVHRAHLVNINKIKEIVPWFSRNYILRMKDEKATEIPVSRTHTRRLREYLKL
jgi:two-component system response regulator LytT